MKKKYKQIYVLKARNFEWQRDCKMANDYSRKAKRLVFIARVVATLILFFLAIMVLVQQETNMKLTLRVQKIQRQIDKVQNENKKLYVSLETYYNLENLEKIADEQFHMVYPEKFVYLKKDLSKKRTLW
ncbi:MAG: hypothetical protein DKM50_11380 [Candidatus Margulisiibacteriota bacterium]|nr:MAG: hypothetical protein DKM50_11380 [Candidatus Margulisiibacteriota bacterium]HAR63876.1 hypothetical protein [Candidatus Margulisiibacteriota bacterium]HCT85887.1 hypothetical protein [Candidatus Margulisiibacteriota bacterium]HCY37673.1 hypothetical protein [Candidatus Margulisiibacteriota bacterium]